MKGRSMKKIKSEIPATFYVCVIDWNTDKVIKQMGPFTESKAEKVADGLEINLDHENFFVGIREVK